jgi:putative transposase
MDGNWRLLDNIFIERLWRSLKYEDVYIKAYGSVSEAHQGIGAWLRFYNEKRPHQVLDYRTPRAVYERGGAYWPSDIPSDREGHWSTVGLST